jgi:hypothetical protein
MVRQLFTLFFKLTPIAFEFVKFFGNKEYIHYALMNFNPFLPTRHLSRIFERVPCKSEKFLDQYEERNYE